MKRKWVYIILGILIFLVAAAVLSVRWGIHLLEKRVGQMTIWVEAVETGNATPITMLRQCSHPTFCPEGHEILFDEAEGNGFDRIGTYDLETGEKNIIIPSLPCVTGLAWHPDGQSVFYIAAEDSQRDIWRHNLVDQSRIRLTDDPDNEYRIKLSEDGRWLLFTQKTDDNREDVFLMDTDGGEKRRMTNSDSMLKDIEYVAWAPNSTEFAFVSFLSVIIMNINGDIVNTISLVGLSNISELFFSPESDDVIYFKAMGHGSTTMRMNLYKLSRKSGSFDIWKAGRSLFELHYDISRDGHYLVYMR